MFLYVGDGTAVSRGCNGISRRKPNIGLLLTWRRRGCKPINHHTGPVDGMLEERALFLPLFLCRKCTAIRPGWTVVCLACCSSVCTPVYATWRAQKLLRMLVTVRVYAWFMRPVSDTYSCKYGFKVSVVWYVTPYILVPNYALHIPEDRENLDPRKHSSVGTSVTRIGLKCAPCRC
jgi:hypothetical protein